jgi:hypothetical protein
MGSKYRVDFKLPINLPSHKRPYMPFGRKLVYTQEVRKASLERLYTSNKSLRLFDADESLPFLEIELTQGTKLFSVRHYYAKFFMLYFLVFFSKNNKIKTSIKRCIEN